MINHLFITGAARSGTTLLDKLMSMHQQVMILSQPLPLLYSEVKNQFFESAYGITRLYPLDDIFLENYIDSNEFTQYLTSNIFQKGFFQNVLSRMILYDGQYIKFSQKNFSSTNKEDSSLINFVVPYIESLVQKEITTKSLSQLAVTGSKEVFSEEYIPYFLANQVKVILLVRDPRDSITSLSFGKGKNFSGDMKPHLFNIRQWRKSVAFIHEMSGSAHFMCTKYEELVTKPIDTMNSIALFLDIPAYSRDAFDNGIFNYNGSSWNSNSSHSSSNYLNPDSIGNHQDKLPLEAKAFIEACCYYEMKSLGYEPEINEYEIIDVLSTYNEANMTGRSSLEFYQWKVERKIEEVNRIKNLRQGIFNKNEYIFKKNYQALSQYVNNE